MSNLTFMKIIAWFARKSLNATITFKNPETVVKIVVFTEDASGFLASSFSNEICAISCVLTLSTLTCSSEMLFFFCLYTTLVYVCVMTTDLNLFSTL